MAIRCAKCQFDSADEALFCDFCKEPFRRQSPAQAAAAPPAEGPKAPAVPTPNLGSADPSDALPAELLEKLQAQLKNEIGSGVPAVPSWVRPAAYAFLGIALFWAVILGGMTMARYQQAKDRAPAASSAR